MLPLSVLQVYSLLPLAFTSPFRISVVVLFSLAHRCTKPVAKVGQRTILACTYLSLYTLYVYSLLANTKQQLLFGSPNTNHHRHFNLLCVRRLLSSKSELIIFILLAYNPDKNTNERIVSAGLFALVTKLTTFCAFFAMLNCFSFRRSSLYR